KIREINDMRDETDLSGLRLAIDLKRGADPDRLMQKLFKSTPLQDAFPCNFNILIAGNPRVMGVREILDEWIAWRTECVRRRIYHELAGKKDRLHLLQGLQRILLDIDRAIEIIRNTELEADVVPNLMMGFGIDEPQAEYVAEIRLRNINREYILKRTSDIDALEKDIADLEATLNSRRRLRNVLIGELEKINKQFPTPRRTGIVYEDELPEFTEEEAPDTDPVTVFLSKEGYFKKITPQSLRMSSEQKYKEGDGLRRQLESANHHELLIFTDRQQVYRLRLSDVEPTKASVLGSFLPTLLNMDEGESVLDMVDPGDYRGALVLAFANGKLAHIPLESYQTKGNRKKLLNAYSDKSRLVGLVHLTEEKDLFLLTNDGRGLVVNSSLVALKTTRNTQGVSAVSLRGRKELAEILPAEAAHLSDPSRYRAKAIPKAPVALTLADKGEEQLSLL
ncbi:MAG: topoisomerase IV, partial [Firmicutes bacterium]|nr:topoisomerase IV [Bacillota bacterium]